MRDRTLGRAVAAVLAAANLAAATPAIAQDKLTAAMVQAGAARIGIAQAPPYAFISPTGEAQGYLVEILAAALMPLGVAKLQATATTFDAMIPGLQARQFDLLPGGLNVTAARCQVVVFTAPVTMQQDALYVKPGNPKKLAGYASVARETAVQLAVLTGSSQEAFALKTGVPASQLVKVPDIQAGIAAVTGGRADAFVAGQFSVSKPGDRGVEAVVDTASPSVGIAFALRKEDVATRDAINAELNKLRADGTMRRLYAEKYGFATWDGLSKLSKAGDLVAECN